MQKIKLRTSLRFLMLEMIITNTLLSMPIMVPFYYSLGMDQGQVGLSQAICAIVMLIFNIPTGWIADRFSRKACNAFGDLGCAISLLIYSQATNFTGVIIGEILFGATIAFSNGADDGLVKGHADRIGNHESLLKHITATVSIWQPIAQVIALMAGGLIGAEHPRIAIALSAVPFFIGGVLSLLVREEGTRLISQHRNPFRDMARVCKETVVPNPKLRWLILAYVFGLKITAVMIWALTPLLILSGVPIHLVGSGWVLYTLTISVGAWLAKKYSEKFKKWQQFAIPAFSIIIALTVMSIQLSLATVWLYAILGAGFGWNKAVIKPMLQNEIPPSNQATAMSLAETLSKVFYAPLIWIIGIAGITNIKLSMIATIVIFLPMIILITYKLKSLKCE